MAVYTLKLDAHGGEYPTYGVNQVMCDPPFIFAPDDVITVVAETKYKGEEMLAKYEGTLQMNVILGDVAVYLPDFWNGKRVSLNGYANMNGENPYQAEIRRGDLFFPAWASASYGSIITYNNNIDLYEFPKTDDLSVPYITVEYLVYEWTPIYDYDYYLTIITPDGGASKFWTGFRGCRELI